MLRTAPLLLLGALAFSGASAAPEPPRPVDAGLSVELVAQEPDIRTPTAITTDPQGRIWVLENNTHFRPKNYDAPPTDRVVLMEDFAPGGKARKFTTFAEGFRDGMGLLLMADGSLIVSTRSEVLQLRDADGDGKADERATVLKMDTKADYPHNGLSGITLGPAGLLYIGLGENFGMAWTITGSDGSSVRGSDEGGIFRCTPEGGKLERWAIGLWNPYGLAFDAAGRLFALDNDPGGGSLCRLVHIVRGGDYGYRYRYGRTTDHPFLSWFGEIPGTLPPVCLSGEAPTGLITHRGELLGATWSDHGIQRFPLQARGASFSSTPKWVVRGGRGFRPSGIAAAPDGSLVISDWADGAYEVHGKGRVWRVRGEFSPPAEAVASGSSVEIETVPAAAEFLQLKTSDANLAESDPFLFHAAIERLAADADAAKLSELSRGPEPRVRLASLLAQRRTGAAEGRELLPKWLGDESGAVRRAALQWISEEKLTDLQPQLETAVAGQLSSGTFRAYLAALQFLTSGKPDSKATLEQTAAIALDAGRPAELRALALRLLPTNYAKLSIEQLQELASSGEKSLRIEAVRIIGAKTDGAAQEHLRELAADASADAELRAEAAAGLAHSAARLATRTTLQQLLSGEIAATPAIQREALRSLTGHLEQKDVRPELLKSELGEALLLAARSSAGIEAPLDAAARTALMPERPAPGQPWEAVLDGGDPAAGRRIFFHPNGARCSTCHTVEGRGSTLGPDLTSLGRFTPAQLLEAIVEPSKNIAPAYVQWLLKLRDGREVSGIDLFEDNKSAVTLMDAAGVKAKYNFADIVSREELPISIMPPGLDQQMTVQDLRDLIAYLREPRE